jgi:hypothetical protein
MGRAVEFARGHGPGVASCSHGCGRRVERQYQQDCGSASERGAASFVASDCSEGEVARFCAKEAT